MSPSPLDLFTAFGVGRRPGSELAEFAQDLGPGLTDHRGLIEMPVLAMLFDDIGGVPFFFGLGPGSDGNPPRPPAAMPSMQSRISMSMLDRLSVDDRLDAVGRVRIDSADYGVTDVEVRSAAGLVCTGTARNMRVGRDVVEVGDHLQVPEPVAPSAPAVAAPDPGSSGGEIIAGLAAGDLPRGPFADLLGVRVAVDGDAVVTEAAAAPWTANIMGTMHGGVIGALVGQGLSYGAQAHTAPGQDYLISEYSVSFLRSPAVDGRPVTVRVQPIKLGRRLSVLQAFLYDGETVLAHAVADVRMDLSVS
ncbi:MAG: PaaI family thioesterase [Gordonia sp. (in: high G+C Gram-positive bacteria)]|uniref:PaaI family thioesterase n=1 Tax=Gordonia sp. (in: high G+C Gram-positive bacteria) TaxID=84139 RepID=UPI0039E3425E